MSKKIPTVNIIGSGLSGMFCGAILAKHGIEVKIFETENKIGGYATSWKRKGFLFDTSLHEINGFFPDDKKLRTFRFLDLFNRIKLIEVPSSYSSVFNDEEFKVPHSYDEFIKKLIERFPEEEKSIKKVMNTIKEISIDAWSFLNEKSKFKAIITSPFKYPTLTKHLLSTIYSYIWKKIKNPRLRTIIAQQLNYHSDNIKNMNLISFATPTYSFISETYWISGTSSSLTNALKDIIEENNGKIYRNKKITKINFKNKKAISIEVNNSEPYYSDVTICNSPLINTIKNLIDKKDFPASLRNKALKTIPSTSLFSIYIGMKIDVKLIGFKEFSYILNKFDDLNDLNKNGMLVDYSLRPILLVAYNLDDSLCPKGKTVVNLCVADNIKHWEKYKNDKASYDKEKKRIAEILIDRVEKKFSGFKDGVEIMEIGTPLTMEKYTHNTDGAVYGACQRVIQGTIFRFPNEIKKRNLYFASAWVSPGGGFSGVITSAIQTTDLILKKYKIRNRIDDYINPKPVLGSNSHLFYT